jgi:hypothetical protein
VLVGRRGDLTVGVADGGPDLPPPVDAPGGLLLSRAHDVGQGLVVGDLPDRAGVQKLDALRLVPAEERGVVAHRTAAEEALHDLVADVLGGQGDRGALGRQQDGGVEIEHPHVRAHAPRRDRGGGQVGR